MIDGETRIGIFATRDIKKGEHLTYDYQYESFLDSYYYKCLSFFFYAYLKLYKFVPILLSPSEVKHEILHKSYE